jgi:hypothetical protein
MFAPDDAALQYCYVGSAKDSSTGEIIDLYTVCPSGASDNQSMDSIDQ